MLKSFFSAVTRASLRYWWVTIGLTVIFLVVGVLSAASLNQELLPPLEFPQTFIITFRPGSSSDDMRDLITLPVEAEVAKIPGVVLAGLESTTTGPVSAVTVRNEYGVNLEQVREQLKAVIKKVTDEGVPTGLKTTADLTPDIVTRVIKRAPTMFKQFNATQLLAMDPAVLNAAIAANPDGINLLDQLTRDQLAAARVDAAVNGEATSREPVDLPDAWRLTDTEQPRLLTFNLSALPVLTSSISSSSADVKADELRQFVEEKIVKPLSEGGDVKDVANVTISGGQQIPEDIASSAKVAVEEQRKRDAAAATATPAPTTTPEPASTTASGTAETQQQQAAAPALPASWRSPLISLPMRLQTQIVSNFATADDLLTAQDLDGKSKTAAEVLNIIAATEAYASLLSELSPDVLAYVNSKDATFAQNLTDPTLELVTTNVLTTGAWSQLLNQAGFQKAGIAKLSDLAKIKGSVAATINDIVAGTPAELQSFTVRLVYSLSPEAVLLLSHKDADFAKNLSPQTLRYLSGPALAALPAGLIDGLSDAALKTELQGIIADPSKAAGKAFEGQTGSSDDIDPNAPALPEGWITGLKRFGLNATQADDLLKKPFGLSPGQFINQSGATNPASLGELNADVLLYLADRDPNFYNELTPETLGALNPDVLAKLPPEVASRAQRTFSPTTTITRANGLESLTLSVVKADSGNTVNVSDGVEEFFTKLKAERPDLVVTEVFGQAGFIKESISGVAREGGLGAVMAVIVILLFLNFSVRSTLVTAVSIPTSVAIAFVMMKYVPGAVHGFIMQDAVYNVLPEAIRTFMLRLFPAAITLNIMTLSGLTVAVGRVVDDAIVVLENIYRQLQSSSADADRREIIIHGTRDVSAAIFAATLTTVVVFLPIGLTGGVVGEFFMPFGLAVTYSLGASFIVAITLVPLLAFYFIKRENIPDEKEGRLESGYHSVLEWALSHRPAVLVVAAATLVIGVLLLGARPATFLPSIGEPQISVAVSLPSGTKIAQTDFRVREFEEYVKTLVDKKQVDRFQIQIGSGGGLQSFIGGGGGISEGSATVTIAPVSKNLDELNALTQEIRTKAEGVFGKRFAKVSRASLSEQGFGGFALVVSGPEDTLRAVMPRIKEELAKVPGLTNITSTLDQVGGTAAYLRIGQTAAVSFSGELETQNTLGVTSDAIAKVKAMSDLPADIVIGQGFQSQQQTEGFAQTFTSMGIAILIVYVVMVFTFGSFVHPFTILFSLPLAIVGAALGLTVTNRVLGLSALIGMLMLIGIVVTNAIVMIDRVQANRKERGMNLHEALVEGARTRLRPILMTAIATIFALLPLAIGLSEGAIIASELGTVVIGGLFSSTLLTLVVVPVIYSLVDVVNQRISGNRKPKAS